MKEKKVYALFKDGKIVKDTHLFLFSDPISPILTTYLFSVTFACKDLSMYELGFIREDTFNPLWFHEKPNFVCDFNNGLDLAKEILSKDEYKNCPITVSYLQRIIDDVDVAIKNRYSSNDDEVGE